MKPHGSRLRRSWVLLLSIILVASGCAKASITPMTASTRPATPFQGVMVVFPVSDLRDRERTEAQFIEVYPESDTVFVSSGTIFSIGARYSARDVSVRLEQNNVDAVLLFFSPADMYFDGRPRDADELVAFLSGKPLNDVVAEMLGDPSINVNPGTAVPTQAPCRDCGPSPRLPTSGVTSRDPWARSAVALREVGSGRVVWTAIARASDVFWLDPSRYFRSIAKQTLAKLQQDGMVP